MTVYDLQLLPLLGLSYMSLYAWFQWRREKRRADMYEKLYFDRFPELRVLKERIERGENVDDLFRGENK
jgi:hypothetical protein